jgi:hypothetical protein
MKSLLIKTALKFFVKYLAKRKFKLIITINLVNKFMKTWCRSTDPKIQKHIKKSVSSYNSTSIYREILIDPANITPVKVFGKYHLNIGWVYLGSFAVFFISLFLTGFVDKLFVLGILFSFGIFLFGKRMIQINGVYCAKKGMLYFIPYKEIERIQINIR